MRTQVWHHPGVFPADATWLRTLRGLLWVLPVSLLAGAAAQALAPAIANTVSASQMPNPALLRHAVEAVVFLLGLYFMTRTAPGRAATRIAERLLRPFARSLTVCCSVPDLGRMIDQRLGDSGALRIMIAGAESKTWAAEDALGLANILAGAGKSVILIDWRSANEKGCAHIAGLKPAEGLTEVLLGGSGATCASLTRVVPGTSARLLTAGFGSMTDLDLDRDDLAEALDALDASFDYVLMTGNHDDARALFEAIEGRIDAAVIVGKDGGGEKGRFLGFDIFDLDLFRLEHFTVPTPVPADRYRRTLKATRTQLATA